MERKFTTFEDKCRSYQKKYDYTLDGDGLVIVHLDGVRFSKLIKDKFKRPFDDDFRKLMDNTASYMAKIVQGCVLAYTQSDEINLLLGPFVDTKPPYGGRLCKLQSILAAEASSYFTKMIISYDIEHGGGDIVSIIKNVPTYMFDCKVWTVPSLDEALDWISFRQNDCLRNSKQQFAQNWCSHKELLGLTTDDQINLCFKKSGNDWNSIDDGFKYGRFIVKSSEHFVNEDIGVEYDRSVWEILVLAKLRNDDREIILRYIHSEK